MTLTRRHTLALMGAAVLPIPARAELTLGDYTIGEAPGLVLSNGPEGWWDSERVSCPRLLIDEDGTWKMWYYGRDAGFNRTINMPTGRIGLATSPDGISWSRVRGPGVMGSVMDPSDDPAAFDSGHLGVGEVKATGTGYEMLYFGGSATPMKLGEDEIPGFPMQPARATSPDGINWTRADEPFVRAGPPGSFDAFNVAWPQIVDLPGGGYRLYYHTLHFEDRFMVCAADSEDGVTWQKLGPVFKRSQGEDRFDVGGPATRQVLRWQGRWLMAYEGFDKNLLANIGFAESDDGLNWRRIDGPLEGGASFRVSEPYEQWDADGVGTPWLMPMPDGSLRMYYVGVSHPVVEGMTEKDELSRIHRIGLAISEDGDPTRWRRHGA